MQVVIALLIAPVGSLMLDLRVIVTVTVHKTVAAVAYDETVMDIVQSVSKIRCPVVLGAGPSSRCEEVPDIVRNRLWLARA